MSDHAQAMTLSSNGPMRSKSHMTHELRAHRHQSRRCSRSLGSTAKVTDDSAKTLLAHNPGKYLIMKEDLAPSQNAVQAYSDRLFS